MNIQTSLIYRIFGTPLTVNDFLDREKNIYSEDKIKIKIDIEKIPLGAYVDYRAKSFYESIDGKRKRNVSKGLVELISSEDIEEGIGLLNERAKQFGFKALIEIDQRGEIGEFVGEVLENLRSQQVKDN